MNYGRVEEPTSSPSRSQSTARRAVTSAILTVTLSRSDRALTLRTVDESQLVQLFEADATFTHVDLLARIRRMHPSLTFSISLIIAANLHSAIAQSSPTPAPTPVTLRSLLLSELHSTHDKAEWFTPIQAAVAGLTAEQAKWVPTNAQGKTDPSANHSVGMLAYHLVFWNENALARLRGEKPASPGNNDETFND